MSALTVAIPLTIVVTILLGHGYVVQSEEFTLEQLLELPADQCIKNLDSEYKEIADECKKLHKSEYLLQPQESDAPSLFGGEDPLEHAFLFLGPETKECVINRLAEEANFESFFEECTNGDDVVKILMDPVPIVTCCLGKVHEFCQMRNSAATGFN